MNLKKPLVRLVFLAFAAQLLAGCPGTGDALIGNNNPRVRAANAFSGPNVDVTVTNGDFEELLLDNRGFGATSGEAIIENGNQTVRFRNSATGSVVSQATALFELNHDYTVVGYGPAGANNMLILGDTIVPGAGNSGVRAANASGSAAPFDIYQGGAGSTIGTATLWRDSLATGVATLYREVPSGTRKFFVTGDSDLVVRASQEFDLAEGKRYTLVIGADGTIQLIMVTDH